jgi:hypothetical protein
MKHITDLNEEFDFGFSAMSDEELKATEKHLESQLVTVSERAEDTKKKLEGMRNMILPLLKNLQGNPDKEYIYWPNRTEKINMFIKKLDAYIEK